MGKMTALLPESLDRCKATQAKFKFPPRRSVPPPYSRAHFDRLIRCFIPRGGMRRRSGFSLSLQPECCPFRAHASQSGAGLGPVAAPPLLSAPPRHRPPLVGSRPLGLPGGPSTAPEPASDRLVPGPAAKSVDPAARPAWRPGVNGLGSLAARQGSRFARTCLRRRERGPILSLGPLVLAAFGPLHSRL